MATIVYLCLTVFVFIGTCKAAESTTSEYWEQYGNNEKGQRFSPLTLINKDNVKQLQAAWIHDYNRSDIGSYYHEATPIMVEDGNGSDVLVYCSPWGAAYGLNPATGILRWNQSSYANSPEEANRIDTGVKTCRGLTSWLDPQKQDGDLCRRVVYLNTITAWLVAMDAATGKLCPDFGENGAVNMTMPRSWRCKDGSCKLMYGQSSAPEIVRNVVITGDSIGDYRTIYTPGGHPRGWHCRTGQLMWQFDIIPDESDPDAYATWANGTENRGGGNVWAPIGGDHDTGLVYIASSSPHFDFYGGDRLGDNLYTDTVIAIDVETGVKKWHYQIVKHDLWNYDLGSQPVVTTITVDGKDRKVVLQATKMASLFVLDALTGEPVFPVDEIEVPESNVPGEETSPTQRVPRGKLGGLVRTTFSADDLYSETSTPEQADYCRNLLLDETMLNITTGKRYTPGGWRRAEMWVPGEIGGCNWGSLSVHPHKQWAIIPVNEQLTARSVLDKNTPSDQRPKWCKSYHSLEGAPLDSCMRIFMHDNGFNVCLKPPWARLMAIDLQTAQVVWEIPYGVDVFRLSSNVSNSRKMLGGVLVTASGLLVSAGSEDMNMWIYDLDTGEYLHHIPLPWDSVATPSTYMTGGEQYIVINSGKGLATPGALGVGSRITAFKVPGATQPTTTTTPQPPATTPTPPVVCSSTAVITDVLVLLVGLVLMQSMTSRH